MDIAPTLRAARRLSRPLRLAPLALALWVNACVSWRPVELTPTSTFLPSDEVRVTRGDNRTVLIGARVVGDMLVGQRGPRGNRVAAPVADIRRLELATVDGAKTAAVVMAVVASLVIAIAIGASTASPGLGDKPIF